MLALTNILGNSIRIFFNSLLFLLKCCAPFIINTHSMLIFENAKEFLEDEARILPVFEYIFEIFVFEVHYGIRNQLHLPHESLDFAYHQSNEQDTKRDLANFNGEMRGDDVADFLDERLVEFVLSAVNHVVIRGSNQLVEG